MQFSQLRSILSATSGGQKAISMLDTISCSIEHLEQLKWQIVTGKKILAGDRPRLIGHKKVARFFLATRLAAYVTMFMID